MRCLLSHTAGAVEAGGLRWGDTRVKGVSEYLSLLLMQLYELDGDPRRKEFLDDLFSFMQKRGESPTACPLCAHPAPPHTPTLPPTQARGFVSLPLISAPRSQLWVSCWLIFNPSAQRGQTCWAGFRACGPLLFPLPSLTQTCIPSPQNTSGCVPPLPMPWVIAGGKAPHCALSLPRKRPQ